METRTTLSRPGERAGTPLLVKEGNKGWSNPSPDARALSPESPVPDILRMKLAGANRAAKAVGLDPLPGKSNYFRGNDPKQWRRNVPNYAKVKYEDVYPGIDLIYYGNQGQLEYDFVVAPGADPQAIRLTLAPSPSPQGRGWPGGAGEGQAVRIDANGDLVIATDGGEIRFRKPVVYQPKRHGGLDGAFRIQHSQYRIRGLVTTASRPTTKSDLKSQHDDNNPPPYRRPNCSNTRPTWVERGLIPTEAIAVDTTGYAYADGRDQTTAGVPTAVIPSRCTHGEDLTDVFVTKLPATTGDALVYSSVFGQHWLRAGRSHCRGRHHGNALRMIRRYGA